MRRTRHIILATFALALTAGCELLVHIDATSGTGGLATGGAGGGATTTSSTTSTIATTSTSTTSTTTTTTTTTGMCTTAADCPPSTNICADVTCDPTTHDCTTVEVPDGGAAAASAQEPGNCKQVVCDGAGNSMVVDDDSNAPVSKEVCITYTCSMGMQVTNYNNMPCTENMGEVCGAADGGMPGVCVPCNVSADCGPGIICLNSHCITSSCSDMVKDGLETDVDCGGGACLPCADHLQCLTDTDCQSLDCGPTLTCTPASCSDSVKNEHETDVDCGGQVCRPQGKLCGTGKGCAIPGDCQSLNCVGVTCVGATCHDGIQNEGETDTDCGGPSCAGTCINGKMCKIDGDCITGDGCQTTMKVCVTQCTDGHQDGLETDVDCGGGACPKCANTEKCKMDSDCTSNACDGVSLVCVANQCADHRQDGNETDTDCGGNDLCSRCGNNQKCLIDGDCIPADGCKTGASICVAQCTDLHIDGNETDMDCGGGTCPTCILGKMCKVDTDCASDGCQSSTKLCVNQCADGHQDGNETDVDCGGVDSCVRCALTQKCLADSDCTSNACDAVSFTCVSSQCSDHRQDGVETAVDCGGGSCPSCALNLGCLVDKDCMSNACDGIALVCVANQCQDHRKDGNETATDCGGSCTPCANGLACLADFDCMSKACDALSLLCVANQCQDHRLDGNETATDCGGGMCPTCAVGLGCLLNSDCTSNACDGISGLCAANQCVDHHLDGAETAVDCGGGTCPSCAVGMGCVLDRDCMSNACDAQALVCVMNQCADHQKDGAETDVDCGGGTCAACAFGLGCALDRDCMSNACDGVSFTCDSDQCADNRKDGAETAVDCGGGTCPSCALGLGCALDRDCMSNACDGMAFVCVMDQCADNRLDGMETDTDCGGPTCPGCGLNKMCLTTSDCQAGEGCDKTTKTCDANACNDGLKNGQETDTDCGGPVCSPCAVGQGCKQNSDCMTGDGCDKTSKTCDGNLCDDGIKDGLETDVDCGGTVCSPCPLGEGCKQNSDCMTGDGCDKITKTCDGNLCDDGLTDGQETDLDCGGPLCSPCADGLTCAQDSDCQSMACDANLFTCVASQCSDHQKDGQETDVDCGGPACNPCPAGDGCKVNGDCTTMACDFMSTKCVASTCVDERQDGNETATDCGGSCPPCTLGQGCLVNGDCTTMACDFMSSLCVASTCDDQRQDGNETATDCGGSCPPCALGQGCKVNGDCTTGVCDTVSGLCVASTCDNQKQDPGETDVDCGGPCPPCAFGLGCMVDADCQSNACDGVSFICDATQCSDNQKDGNETGVDCGGGSYMGAPPCPTCPNTEPCLVNGDCTSNLCNGGFCAACVNNSDCPSDLCNAGVCMNCATSSDCPSDLCVSSVCTACTSDAQCQADPVYGPGTLCVSGACATGNCHTDADCSGQICGLSTPNTCGACTSDTQCQADPSYGSGTVCVSGACATGNCHTDADCSGQICGLSTPNTCGACTSDTQCQADPSYGASTTCNTVAGTCQ